MLICKITLFCSNTQFYIFEFPTSLNEIINLSPIDSALVQWHCHCQINNTGAQ